MEVAPQPNQQSNPQPSPQELGSLVLPELVATRYKLQILLAVEAAKVKHPDLSEVEAKALAMKEWTGGKTPDSADTLAAHFSDYLADPAHAHERFDISNPEALKTLLREVQEYKRSPESLH